MLDEIESDSDNPRSAQAFALATGIGAWSWQSGGQPACDDRCRALLDLPAGWPVTLEGLATCLAAEDREAVRQAVRQAAAGRGVFDVSIHVRLGSGSLRRVRLAGEAVGDGHGGVALARGGCQALDEFVALPTTSKGTPPYLAQALRESGMHWPPVELPPEDVQLRLRHSEAMVRVALAASGASAGVQDRHLRYTWLYRSTDPSAAIGKTDEELGIAAETLAQLLPLKRAALAGAAAEAAVTEGRRTLHTRCEPVRGPDGDVEGVVTVALDVTEQVEREHEVRTARDRLALVFEHSAEMIALIGVEPGPSYRFLDVNRRLLERFGFERDNVVGHEVRTAMPPVVSELYVPAFDRILASRQPERLLYQSPMTLDRYFDGHVTPVVVDGQVTHLLVTVLDVTEQRHAEAALRERETQLFEARKTQAVGRLAGGIAHDFNNLLTVVQGYAALVATQVGPNHPALDGIDAIERAAERAAVLTRQLLAYSGRQMVAPRTVAVRTLFEEAAQLVRRIVRSDVRFHATPACDEAWVRLDPAQFEHVLLQLATNSEDWMPGGGTLDLEAEVVEVAAGPLPRHGAWQAGDAAPTSGRYALVRVTDTGPGIAPDVLDHVFDPFFTTKPPGRGTGLGLSAVQGIVHQAGGSVLLDTTPGQGTTVTLLLPLVARPVDERQVHHRPILARRPTVLVVDDEPLVLELAAIVLESAGYEVLAAGEGRHALRLASERPTLDLVITDVVMDPMGGRELAERLAGVHPGVPTVFMSGFTDDEVLRLEIGPGAQFLHKPFQPAELVRVAQGLLVPGG